MKTFLFSLTWPLLFKLTLSTPILSQETGNPRTNRKHGLSLKAGGDYTAIGLAYDIFVSR